ncbi:MAG TPA: hypothetical protein VFA47_02110 [Candidatus Manganitrophaceae bacterium]|nr:hypothetical protein [Candidatus Manganitrophaceae bacterium]
MGEVVFVDDLQAEGFEHGPTQRFVHQMRLAGRNEADLLGEIEIKIEELSPVPRPDRIIDEAVVDRRFERVFPVDPREAGITILPFFFF